MAEAKKIHIEHKSFDPEGGLKEKLNPVILLHAMLCSKEAWVDIPQRVANFTKRRVYTYDARNHGDSDATKKSNFIFNVEDLFNLMDTIKAEMKDSPPEKFVVVGHDMGGMTAISAALQKAGKFEMVIILEMHANKIDPVIIERAKIFTTKWADCVRKIPGDTPPGDVTRLSVENLYRELADSMKEEIEKESYKKVNFSFKKTGDHYEVKYHTDNIKNALDQLMKHEGYEGEYNGPAYFFYGSESHYKVVKEVESIKKHFPDKKFVEFKKGSHFFVADVPEKVAEELGNIIKNST